MFVLENFEIDALVQHKWLEQLSYPYKTDRKKCWYFLKAYPILVWKLDKKKFFTYVRWRYRNFKIWHPSKQTKSKNRRHFYISTFENLQLCFFVQNDSFTLKVLKMQFVFGWAIIRNIADWICNVPYRRLSQRQIAFLGPLEWMNLFGQKSKVVSFQKLI